METVTNVSMGALLYVYTFIGCRLTPCDRDERTSYILLLILTHMLFWPVFRAIAYYRKRNAKGAIL